MSKVTAETITDEQIRSLRTAASDHAVTVTCRRALGLAAKRQELDQACREVAEAAPTGQRVEFLNARLVEIGIAVGRTIIAREQCADAWNARHGGDS